MFSKSASHFKLFRLLSAFVAGLVSFISLSCELGLGSAVDVQPPEIEISGPVANDIIYEKFVMSGKWSDDRNEISGISIVLENTTTKQKFGPYNVAEENLQGNKWSYEINPLSESEKIPDGKYNATVTCTDKESHSTIATVAFTLDNTPPLVVLARPSTKIDSNSPDGYGCEFSLEGEAVDDNVITLVEVNVYDSETKELKKTVQLENVSKKIDRTVAVFGAADKAYEEIYGAIEELEQAVQKRFYCEVVAYDEARRVPAVEGDKGNHSTCFYLESEVSKFIKQYKSSGFYEIIKGTYDSVEESEARTAEEEASLNAARTAIKENAITQASFSLDPRNNPRYTISSYSNFKELKGEGDAATPVLMRESAKLTNNNTVTVNLLSGLDEYYIIKDTIGISLVECDSNGVVGKDAKEIMLFAPYKNKAGEVIVDANGNPLVADPAARENRIKTTGSTYSVDVTIGTKYQPEMAIGKFYVFKSYGYDENGREIHNYANTDYGFKLVSANAKPEINLTKLIRKSEAGNKESTSTSTVELSAAERLVICGTAKLDDLIPNLQFNLGLSTDLSGEDTLLGTMKADLFAESGFECTIPDEWNNKKFVIRITAINPEEPEQKTSERISVTWDCTGPVIGQAAVSPTVSKIENEVTKSYVNGVVNIKTSVSDAMNVVEKVEYAIAKAGEDEGARKVVEDISGVGFDIDTTLWDDESGKGNAVVAIYATDSAGNETRRAVVLNIDQSTDQPVIELNNADSKLNSVEGIVGASHQGKTNNIFGTITNTVILGTISDDDGIDTIQVFVAPEGSDFPSEPKETFTVGGDKTKAIQAKVSDTEGKFKVRIVVSDSAKHDTGFNSAKTADFLVAVDDGAPNFTISTDSGALQAANTAIPVKGKASDGASFVIQRFKEKECLTVLSSSISVDAEGSWEDTISREEVGETGKTFYYKAEDEFGQKTVLSFSYLLDAIMPGFSIKRIGPNEYNPALTGATVNSAETTVYVKAGDPLNISGEVWDTGDVNNRSGLQDYVFYKLIKQSDGEPEKNEAGNAYKAEDWDQSNKLTFTTTETEQRGTWTKAVDISSGYDDGEKYVLYIAAKDNSRNISAIAANPCQTVIIVPDSQGPVITGQSADKTQITLANNTQHIFITATITDAVSGVNKVELYEGDSAYKYEKTNVPPDITHTGSSYEIKISAEDLLNGTHSLKIRATDKAGNYKDSDPINISVDILAPSIGYVSGAVPTTLSGTDNVVNGIVKISGLASDETKLHKIYWYIDNKDTATDDQKYVCLENESGSKNFTFEVDTRELSDGQHTFYVYAEDTSGNTSPASSTPFEVLRSSDDPVFVLDSLNNTNYNETDISATNNVMKPDGKVTGTVTDDDELVEVKFVMDEGTSSEKTYTVNSFKNKKSYSFNIPLTTLFDVSSVDLIVLGNHTIRIVATDNAGGYTTFKDVPYSAASKETNEIHFGVDKGAPEIIGGGVEFQADMGNHRDTNGVYYKNEAFTGTFTVKDDVSLLAVKATNGTTATAVAKDDSQQSFVFTINPKYANTTEKFTLEFEAEDKFHQKNSVSYNVVFDFDKPSVDDSSTWNFEPELTNGNYFKKENTLTISGKSSEDKSKETGLYSGLKNAKYKIDEGGWQPASSFTETSGDWTVKLDANSIDEGPHTISVWVTDLAGNTSEVKSKVLICDGAAPVIKATTNAGVFSDTVTISGTVEDKYLNSSSLAYVLKKGGEEVTNRTGSEKPEFTETSGIWTFTMPKGTNGAFDGEYTVDLTVEDNAEHTGSLNGISFLLDTKNPEIEISTPSDSSTTVAGTNRLSSLNNKFEGTVTDANLESVFYMISKNDPVTDTEDSNWKSASNTATSWNIWENFVEGKIDSTDAGNVTAWSEGKYYINVFAKDKVGNKSSIVSRYFEFDKNAPVVESFVSSSSMTNADFTLSGTVVETNGISGTAKIQVKKDTGDYSDYATDVALSLETGSTSRYTFSKAIKLSKLSGDGDYTFRVIVTDVSNQTNTEKTVSVKVDNTPPEIFTVVTPNSSKSSRVTVNGTVGDTGSGVKNVYYQILSATASAPTNGSTGWKAVAAASSWIANEDVSGQGKYIVYAYAEDNVGNKTSVKPTGEFIIDTEAPVSGSLNLKRTAGGTSEVITEGESYNVNKKDSGFTVSGKAHDNLALGEFKLTAQRGNETPVVLINKGGIGDQVNEDKVTVSSDENGEDWTWSYDANFTDGKWKFKVEVKEKAELQETSSVWTVVLDKTDPSISNIQNEDGTALKEYYDALKAIKIKCDSTDGSSNQSGLDSVKYFIARGKVAAPLEANKFQDWDDASKSGSSWLVKVDAGVIPESQEGEYTIFIKATDKVGNEKISSPIQFIADTKDPVVVENSVLDYYGVKDGEGDRTKVEITGTVTDTYFDSMEIAVTKNGTSYAGATKSVPVSGGDWKVILPVNVTTHENDGVYTVKATFKDKSGKSKSTSLISTSIDTTAPEIEAVTTLAVDGSTVAKVEDFKITGKAKDNLPNGLSSVKYRVDTAVSATAGEGEWKEATGTLNWNFYQKFIEGKTSSADALCEGTYYLHVYAVDNAGNVSSVVDRKFEVDFNKPVVSINALAASTKEKFTLSGTASDTRGLKVESEGIHSGKSVVKVEQTNPSGGKTSFEYEVSEGSWTSGTTLPALTGSETKLSEGLYSYKVTVEDEVGNKTSESSSQIRWDVSAPALKITSHSFDADTKESGWQTTNTLTLTGSASDATGVQSVSFKEGAAEYEVLPGTTSWTKELSNLSQGPHTIKFKTVDTNGSEDEFTYVLNIDSEAPVMGTNQIKRGATASEDLGNGTSVYANLKDTLDSVSGKHKFTLSGSATDSYKLGSIVVKAVNAGTTKTLVNKTTKNAAETDSSWNWAAEVLLDSTDSAEENYLSNGTWDFSVTVKDKAGTHTVVETFKVIIDTVNSTLTPTYNVPSSAEPRNNSSVTVKPVAADTNGSGVDSVSYVILDSDNTETQLNEVASNLWETISGANRDPNTTKNISFPDGQNYLYLKVVDKAGNYSYSSAYRAAVDKEAPVIVMGNPAAVACVNGSNDIDVSDFEIEVKDERGTLKSGIKQVDVYIDSISAGNLIATSVTPESGAADLSVAESGKVSGTIAKEKFASKNATFKIYVQVTDVAGNTAYTNTNIGIDKAAPDATIKTTAKNNVGNKNLTLEGTTYDLNGVASVKVEFQTGEDSWKDVTDAKENGGFGLTMGGSTAAWSFVIPTYDESTYATTSILNFDADSTTAGHQTKFRVTVTDIAKNKTSKELTVTIDQDADRPVVEFKNLSSNGQILQTPTISGNISDDDTWDDTCVFKIDSVNHSITEWQGYTQKGTLTIDENGIFDYTPAVSSDGEKTMYFYIKDSAGTEFVTAAVSNEVMDMPKIIYKGNSSSVDNSAVIKYTADTVNPAIKEMKVGATAEKEMAETEVVGGNTNSIKLSVTALDAVGLTSARAELNGNWYTLSKDETSLETSETFNDLSQNEKPSVTIAANGKKAVFTSSAISISGWTSGRYDVTFEIIDNAGRKSSSSGSFTVDNQGPQVEITNFANWADEQTGGISWDLKFTDYPNSNKAGIAKYGYLVLNDDYLDGSNKADTTKIKKYMNGDSEDLVNSPAHTVDFTGTTVTGVSLTGLPSMSSDDPNSKFKNISVVRKDVYNLPIYFYTVDKLGNENLESFTIIYNVFGGRPSTNVAYPAGTDENPQVMNGTIRLSGGAAKGTATGAGNVEKVFVQFDVTKNTDFSSDDMDKVAGYKISGSENKVFTIIKSDGVSVTSGAAINWDGIGGSTGFWGIDVSGTNPSNWYKVINENLEFQNDDTLIKTGGVGTGVYRVAVRAVTLASDGVFGAWSPVQYFNIDTNIPEIKQDAKIIADSTSDYVQDMYVKGDAKLQIVAVDKLDVTKVMVYTADTQAGLNDAAKATIKTLDLTDSTVAERYTETGKKGYTINIPLPRASSNKSDIYVKVVAYKENEASAYREYHINFDNTAPTINSFQFNSKEWESADESTHKIVNSNGKFTISGSATDEASGYDKVGFYFIRGDVSDVSKYRARIYDPMSASKEILVKAKDGTSLELAEKELGEQKMYGAEYTGVSISEVTIGTEKFSQITLKGGDSVNENIKKAGYVEVGGNFYKIDKVDSGNKKITLTTNVPVINGSGNATVFFPFMQFVENTGSEKTDEDGLGFTSYPNSDDGDGMPESIIKSQRTWTWDASIQSTNIPDGPGTMVVFVWDKAGNVSAASYACSVQNNAPRLVKLHLGTDLSGDNKFSDSEFVTYDVLNQDGRQSAYTMSTSSYKGTSFRIKDKLAVVPEFVGGNYSSGDKDIKMVLNRAADSETKNTVNTIAKGNKIKNSSGDETTDVMFTDKKSGDGSILSDDCLLVTNRGYTDVNGTSVQNNIWAFLVDNYNIGAESPDEDVNNGVGHRNISFTFWDSTDDTVQGTNSCYMYLKLVDLIVDIKDNTPPVAKIHPFYWDSWTDSSVALDSNDMPRGHIDLEADLGEVNPDIAGTVLFRGSAYDATKVTKIYVKEPDAEEPVLVGQWNSTNKEWEKVTTGWPEGWEDFEVTEDSGITLDGQTIEFIFKMNMTKYGVANEKTLYVYAEDGNTNRNSDAESQTTAVSETNKYTVDCVPYIQKLAVVDGTTETQLSRSRLGRYVGAVKAGRKLRIYGMNFTSTATYTVNFYESNGTTGMKGNASTKVSTVANANVTKANGYIDVAMPEYSCWVEVVVGTGASAVTTPNNTNANKKYNITKGTLNESTGKFKDGENFWTDDVYLSVWSTGGYMDKGDNPLSGTLEKFTENGTKYVSKQGKSVNENDIFAIWGSNDQMLFDEVYYSSSTDAAQVSHVRGTSVCNSSDGFFKTPPTKVDVCMANNIPFYVILDNGLVNGNTWGQGLLIMREGYYMQDAQNGGKKYAIESQGNGNALSRDSSDGMDEHNNQFDNPKIAVHFDGTNYHIYTCYYDTYARCLKYSKHIDQKNLDVNYTYMRSPMRTWDNPTEGYSVVDGYDTVQNEFNGSTWDCGAWSDIKLKVSGETDTEPIPVIAYYDKYNHCLKVAKGGSTAPKTGRVDGTLVAGGSETAWTYSKLKNPSNSSDFGRYVSMEMDSAGGLHIVAQDVTNSVLCYGYVPYANLKSGDVEVTWQVVDSTSAVGRWTDIKLGNSGGTGLEANPYIVYMDAAKLNTTSAVKVAYATNYSSQKKKAGGSYETVTQVVWECMTDPAVYEAEDTKLSLVLDAKEKANVTNKVAVGINASMFAVDFLRDEQ
ncbi:MAG: Ig-like domain-containing protein [Treponema sp.]|nr:Ig-like domain-containing protein [Treponema sp.]